MVKISQYPRNADGTPMDLEVCVLTDTNGNSGARLTSPPVGPDSAPIPARGLVFVDEFGTPIDLGGARQTFSSFDTATSKNVPANINVVTTNEYITGSKRGGATYAYDATVNGAYVATNPLTSFIEGGGRGFRLVPDIFVTPYQFGAQGGYANRTLAVAGADDSAAILALLAHWKASPTYTPTFLGLYWGTSQGILIQGPGGALAASNSFIEMGYFCAVNGSTGTDLLTINWKEGLLKGLGGAFGTGGTTLSSRGWKNAVRLVDTNGIRIPDGFDLAYFKRHGLYVDTVDINGNPQGNCIGLKIGDIKATEIGAAAYGGSSLREQNYTFDSATYNGSSNTGGQTSTLHFTTPLDVDLQSGDKFAYINTDGKREAYEISVVDLVGNTLTFYHWIRNLPTAGTMRAAFGCVVLLQGGNTAYSNFGQVTAVGAGEVWSDRATYGSVAKFVGAEASCIAETRGNNNPASAFYGGAVLSRHAEGCYLDRWHGGLGGVNSAWVGPHSAMATQTAAADNDVLGQIFRATPLLTGGVNRGTYHNMIGFTFMDNFGSLLQEENAGQAIGPGISSPTTVTLSNRPHERQFRYVYGSGSAAVTLNIDWHQNYADLKSGKHWMQAEIWGGGARGEVGSITVQLTAALIAAGCTLNGGTSPITLNNLSGPAIIRVLRDVTSSNFTLKTEIIKTPLLSGITYQGDASVTLNAGTSTGTNICNVPLTANRVWTVQATNAKNGDRLRSVRTAASTGAFNLTVAGKVLATGQFVEHEFDGSAWQESLFGSL